MAKSGKKAKKAADKKAANKKAASGASKKSALKKNVTTKKPVTTSKQKPAKLASKKILAAKKSARPTAKHSAKPTAKQSAKPSAKKSTLASRPQAKTPIRKKANAQKTNAQKALGQKTLGQKANGQSAKSTTGKHVSNALPSRTLSPSRTSSQNTKKAVAVSPGLVNGQPKTATGKSGALNPQKNVTRGGTLPKTTTPSNNHKMPNAEKISKQSSKSAPPMRLSVNDSDVIASAKVHFGAKDLENFKKIIIEQRAESSEEFDIISEQMLDTSGEFDADNQAAIHSAEQGTDAMEREKTFLHAQRTSDYIKKLDEALERIERGTYGICVVCGDLIEKGRLEAVPITQKHVDCKNKTQAKKLTSETAYREVEEAVE